MRNLPRLTTFLIVVATSVVAEAQETWRWARNLEEARGVAAETNRLVLIHFGAKDCAPCQRLEKEVFAQPGFGQSLASEYVGVKVDPDLYPAMARQLGVESWPTDVIVTPELQLVERIMSPRSNAGYVATMAQIAADHRHQQAVAAAPYQRPVVSYGAVRSSAPVGPPPAVAQTTQPAPQRDRYANYSAQQEQQPVAPPRQDRYAGYQSQSSPVMAPPVTQDRYAEQVASRQAMSTPAPRYADAGFQAPGAPTAPATQPLTANPSTGNPAALSSGRPAATQDQLPPGAAPLALDGYCPVALAEQQRWTPGDVRFGVTHEARTYLFRSAVERDKFFQQPHRYAPVMAGNDPVLATDNGQLFSGRREHGLFVNGRIFLFASEDSLAQFERNRDRYVQSVNRTLR